MNIPKMGERGFQPGCGCCVGPESDRCVCHMHQDISRGIHARKCSLHGGGGNPNICPIAPNEIITALLRGRFKAVGPVSGAERGQLWNLTGDGFTVIVDGQTGEVTIRGDGIAWRLDLAIERLGNRAVEIDDPALAEHPIAKANAASWPSGPKRRAR